MCWSLIGVSPECFERGQCYNWIIGRAHRSTAEKRFFRSNSLLCPSQRPQFQTRVAASGQLVLSEATAAADFTDPTTGLVSNFVPGASVLNTKEGLVQSCVDIRTRRYSRTIYKMVLFGGNYLAVKVWGCQGRAGVCGFGGRRSLDHHRRQGAVRARSG